MRRLSWRTWAALGLAVLLVIFAAQDWPWLQRGYSIGVSLDGAPASVSHISFPNWRLATHLVLWFATLAAIALFGTGARYAAVLAWAVLACAGFIGVGEIIEYGTSGTPTSLRMVLLQLAVALAAQFGARRSKGVAQVRV